MPRNNLPNAFWCFEASTKPSQREDISDRLAELTSSPVIESEILKKKRVKFTVYFPKRREAEKLLSAWHLKVPGTISARIFKLSDWKTRWKRDIKARKVTPRLWIIPSWDKARLKPGEKAIYLDPGLAFGTGLHPTTRFVLRLIDRHSSRIGSFIDVGTGSGILAIAARRLGARRVRAFDFDSEAVRVSKENFKRNRVSGIQIEQASLEKFRSQEKFDFVAANIETDILLNNKNRLLSLLKPEGFLALTGIGTPKRQKVLEAYRSRRLKLVSQFKTKDWSGFCLQHTRG